MAFHNSKSNHSNKAKKSVATKSFYEDDKNRMSLKGKEKMEKTGKSKWRAHEFELGNEDDE
jgi:hypothetical protein